MLFLKPEHGPCGSSETPSSARNARNSQPWLGRAHQRDRGCTGAMVDRRPRRGDRETDGPVPQGAERPRASNAAAHCRTRSEYVAQRRLAIRKRS